jgi:phospholipid transport system substrate-binding protein
MPAYHLKRRCLLGLVAALTASPAGEVLAQETSAVTAPIQRFYVALLAIMRAGRTTPFTRRYDTLAPALEQALNVPVILRTAVGFAWPTFPPSEQSALLTAFRHYTVSTWVSNFDSFSGQKLEVLPQLRSVGQSQVVDTRIVKPDGSSSVIDFVMRPAGSDWKATDVLLDGTISQVAVLRSDFLGLVVRGPRALAENLEQKATDLMGGTSPM